MILPARGAATVERVLIGAGVAEEQLLRAVGSARGHVTLDVMNWENGAAVTALHSALEQGAHVRMLTSPLHDPSEFILAHGLRGHARSGRFEMRSYRDLARRELGRNDLWQHSKLAVLGQGPGARAWFTNVAPWEESPHLIDVALELGGAARNAAAEVAELTFSGGSRVRTAGALDDAARAGLLVNDPVAGRMHISHAYDSLIERAQRRLTLVVKGLDDADIAAGLVRAQQRGVNVSVVTHSISEQSAGILADGGVPTLVSTRRWANRVNLVASDGAGMVSSAYPIREVLRPSGRLGTTAGRESAVLIDGPTLRVVERELGRTTEGTAAGMLAAGWAPHDVARTAPSSDGAGAAFSSIVDPTHGANIVDVVR